MNRRRFLATSTLLAAPSLLGRLPLFAQTALPMTTARIKLDPANSGKQVPQDFTGLSYESSQLADPGFFSASNTELIGMVRRLGDQGVLRIGGNTSEYCFWAPDGGPDSAAQGPIGPDPGHNAPVERKITPQAIRNLRDFLDATGWNLIYGLNMGKGTAADAAAQAAYVVNTVGRNRVIAFQLCNEPDLFKRNGIRKPDYDAQQFNDEWQQFFTAIRARVPDAPFAGPDTAYGQDWLVPFATRFKDKVKFLSSHYYAEGPPTDPSMTIERLLANPKLKPQLEGMQQVMTEMALPFRLAETNSCYAAGKQGVSDTFASALWGADLMYQLAQAGGMGINFHGGAYGWYTPIAGTKQNGFVARPIYYGMLLFAVAGPGTMIGCALDPLQDSVSAYAILSSSRKIKLAVFNKDLRAGARLTLAPGQRFQRAIALRLYAPGVDDTTDITLGGAPVGASGIWSPAHEEVLHAANGEATLELPAASAALVTFE